MNNFTDDVRGYNKEEVNSFVDYVIKRVEDNIFIINKQDEEIKRLKDENERLKKLENSYNYINSEIRRNAEREANLIIKNAKDNASILINDALIKTKKIEEERKIVLESFKSYRIKAKKALEEQMNILDDIELL